MAVYFARPGMAGTVKIGYTAGDPKKRVRSLQTGTPHRLRVYAVIENAGPEVEAELHGRFARDRIGGEWFRLSVELMDFIREHSDKDPVRPVGRPPKGDTEKFVPISARVPPPLAKRLAELRKDTGETLSAQVEDGLRRHIKARTLARRRQPSGD